MSADRKEVWVLRGRMCECWEEGSMSDEKKEVWVLRGRKYECWVEGSMSVERKEVWVLSGRKYDCWFYKKRRTLQHWQLFSASRYEHYRCCPNIGQRPTQMQHFQILILPKYIPLYLNGLLTTSKGWIFLQPIN